MELIRKLGTRLENNRLTSWAIFLCPFCLKEVERRLSQGKRDKSCGCMKNELISKTGKGRIAWNKGKPAWNKGLNGLFIGKNSSFYGKKHTGETKEKIRISRKGKYLGEDNPNWNNGSSFEPYPPEFNKVLKQFILERDKHTCQNPNCEYKTISLDIHHIDYDKQNNNPKNLITLCDSCHAKTNFNRQYWIYYYKQGGVNESI